MADNADKNIDKYTVKDPDAFAHNLARVFEGAGKALAAYIEPREQGRAPAGVTDNIVDMMKTLGKVGEYWLAEPQRAVEAQMKLWTNYGELWQTSMRRLMGEAAAPVVEPTKSDKRFKDADWSDNQFFDFCKQAYLITSQWAESLVDEAAELDPHTRHKADFYVTQIANALSPSNFVMTNPELLRETIESNGENLVRGMQNLAEDIRAGGGDLKIRQTDPTKFKVGENLAVTPGKVIYQNAITQIIQYEPTTEKVLKRPLLVVPPWINKFYILDLVPEKSFVKWAVEQGHTVYVISWVNPDASLGNKTIEDYMLEGVVNAVDVVCRSTRFDEVNAVGYCVGGTLLATSLAYMAAKGDERVKTATFLTTQVDFTHAGDLLVFIDEDQLDALDKRMSDAGVLEGKSMANTFNLLRSNDLVWPYVVNNYIRGKDPFPFDLLYWNSDATRMAAANHSFYLRQYYLNNKLSKGELTLGGELLDLAKIKVPIFNLATKEDHIAPAKSVFTGCPKFGGEVEFVVSGSGHIAGVVNPPAKMKYQYWTNGPVQGTYENWLGTATEHAGSWWPHWQEWILAHDATMVNARKVGNSRTPAIEDAPGSFVKMMS
ncbi:MAG: class I poly(R)-hydroxyalkanoic acid synthase [Hyphomicrobiales bacterium]